MDLNCISISSHQPYHKHLLMIYYKVFIDKAQPLRYNEDIDFINILYKTYGVLNQKQEGYK